MDITWGTVALSLGSALIGTLLGAWGVIYLQGAKNRKIRKLAEKALKIIKKYAKQQNTYIAASNEFNTSFSLAEKRAILVALHKVGVPIAMPTSGPFSVKEVTLLGEVICKDEVDDMITQMTSGNCDHLFFADIDAYFNENLRINTIRNIAKKYVNELFINTKYDHKCDTFIPPENSSNTFTNGEIEIIEAFKHKTSNAYYYDSNGNADKSKLSTLVKEIDIGLWDRYLQWSLVEYTNLLIQREYARQQVGCLQESAGVMACANRPLWEEI